MIKAGLKFLSGLALAKDVFEIGSYGWQKFRELFLEEWLQERNKGIQDLSPEEEQEMKQLFQQNPNFAELEDEYQFTLSNTAIDLDSPFERDAQNLRRKIRHEIRSFNS